MQPNCFRAAARGIMLALGVVALAALPATGAGAADAANGGTLAKRWCAACHVVASDQRTGNPDVPTFAAIGKKPGFTAEKTARFLLSPHPVMPNMSLTRNEAADLAAYIATQAK